MTIANVAERLITQLEAEIVKRDARIVELEAEIVYLKSAEKERNALRDELASLKAQKPGATHDPHEAWLTDPENVPFPGGMTTDLSRQPSAGVVLPDLIAELKKQADEIAREGHAGWGNTMLSAAEALSVAGVEDERAAFEAWYSEHYYEGDESCTRQWLFREPCGNYRHEHASRDWRTWQARAALSPAGGVVLPERKMFSEYDPHPEYPSGWNDCLDEVARLNPCRAQAVAEGYVIAPVEPTEIMQDAGCAVMPTVNCHPYDAGMVYKAMLAAAPSAQKESGDE